MKKIFNLIVVLMATVVFAESKDKSTYIDDAGYCVVDVITGSEMKKNP